MSIFGFFSFYLCAFSLILNYDTSQLTSRKAKLSGAQIAAIFIILVLCWMPYVIIWALGSLNEDMAWQIDRFTGQQALSSHHPLVSTAVYGSLFTIGEAISHDGGGILFSVIIQTLVFAASITYLFKCLVDLKAQKPFLIGSLLFFCLVPVFGSYCQDDVKDTLFTSVFCAYFVQLIKCALAFSKQKEEASMRMVLLSKNVILLFVFAVAVSMLRNNGPYVVILSLPLLAHFLPARIKKKGAALLCALALIGPVLNIVIIEGTGAVKGNSGEMLSIPFQQTARSVVEHDPDISDSEKQVIDSVLRYSDIAQRYQWNISDQVKYAYDGEKPLLPYFQTWLQMGIKYPVSYLDAVLDLTYGYWFVEMAPSYPHPFATYRQTDECMSLDVHYYFEEELRSSFTSCLSTMKALPGFGLLTQTALYCVMLVIECTFLLSKKRARWALLLFPHLVLLLTCLAGPVNGYIRYVLPLIATAPLTLWFSIFASSCSLGQKTVSQSVLSR